MSEKNVIETKKQYGNESENVAIALDNWGVLLQKHSQYKKSKEVFQQALSIRKSINNQVDNIGVIYSYNNLAQLYIEINQWDKAKSFLDDALKLLEKSPGEYKLEQASIVSNLGDVELQLGHLNQAENHFNKSKSILNTIRGLDVSDTQMVLENALEGNRAQLRRMQGRTLESKEILEALLADQTKILGFKHPMRATTLSSLGEISNELGDVDSSITYFQEALSILELSLGDKHVDVALLYGSLADVHRNQGNYAIAVPMANKALEILEQTLGKSHISLTPILSILAGINYDAGLTDQAKEHIQRTLHIIQTTYGEKHWYLADTLTNLAEIERLQNNIHKSHTHYNQAYEILTQSFGLNHPKLVSILRNQSALDVSEGNIHKALEKLLNARTILIDNYGPEHPELATLELGITDAYDAQGNTDDALISVRRATNLLYKRYFALGGNELNIQDAEHLKGFRKVFLRHIDLILKSYSQASSETKEALINEAFKMGQLAEASSTAMTIASMSARFSSGKGELGSLIRSRQETMINLREQESFFSQNTIENSGKNATKQVHEEIQSLKTHLAELDTKISIKFPAYSELSKPEPVNIHALQNTLTSSEGLLMVVSNSSNSYIWAIQKENVKFYSTPLGDELLRVQVASIRGGLDPHSKGKKDQFGLPINFPASKSFKLYSSILGPAEPYYKNVETLYVVAGGALQSLPFGVLLTENPKSENLVLGEFSNAPWLLNDHALAYLPAVSTLKTLRIAKNSNANYPFIGIGDPLFSDHPTLTSTTLASANGVISKRGLILKKKTPQETQSVTPFIKNESVLHSLPSLPETAHELTEMAYSMGASLDHLMLRQSASEEIVRKRLLQNQYKVIAFATHGLVADELKGYSEPSLTLTPPNESSNSHNDGMLTASEIATMKLDSDWVILSACNTASADGSFGAEGLSGLAKAFFHAGARSLFVSHWSVLSKPTVKLTTKMLSLWQNNSSLGRAKAHRLAQLSLLKDESDPILTHPAVWAPFIVVGSN